MSSRIEIEITSTSEPERFNWRAVGAREPKGVINSSLLPDTVQIGDSFRVEADFLVDGIEILRVLPKREERNAPETLEVFGSKDKKSGVTTSLVKKKRKNRRDKKSKGRGKALRTSTPAKTPEKRQNAKPASKKAKNPRRRSGNVARGKRIKPKRIHRKKVIDDLPQLHQPLAKEVLSGGIPNLRKTIKKMELPEGFDVEIIRYAETINTVLKTAEWQDRADATIENSNDVDLRDFRSVVAAAGQWARSDDLQEIKSQLEISLKERLNLEHERWLSAIEKAVAGEKSVRALNLSSHPPKPGTPLPEDLRNRLVTLVNNSLNNDSSPHRWSVVVQAVAYSPIRLKVRPVGLPERPTDELLTTVRGLAERIPTIAEMLEITPKGERQSSKIKDKT